jgi:hypothetical protein
VGKSEYGRGQYLGSQDVGDGYQRTFLATNQMIAHVPCLDIKSIKAVQCKLSKRIGQTVELNNNSTPK